MMKISSVTILSVALSAFNSASAFVVSPSQSTSLIAASKRTTTTTTLNLYQSAQQAIVDAQRVCAEQGAGSEACKVAWDIVEELEAADSHKNVAPARQGPVGSQMQQPDYLAFMASFDILAAKINGKMDQLKATTDSLQQMGVTDPNIVELGLRAQDMKICLQNAKYSLDNMR